MRRTKSVSELTGLTRRALQHFENIGLLSPQRTESHYREYSDEDLWQLFSILSFREVGYGLKEIKAMFDAEEYDQLVSLERQITELEEKRRKVEGQLAAARILREAVANNEVRLGNLLAFLLVYPEHAWILEVGEEGDSLEGMRRLRTAVRGLSEERDAIAREMEKLDGTVNISQLANLMENVGLGLSLTSILPDIPPSLPALIMQLLAKTQATSAYDDEELQAMITAGRERIRQESGPEGEEHLLKFARFFARDDLDTFGALEDPEAARRARLTMAVAVMHNFEPIDMEQYRRTARQIGEGHE